MFDYTHCLDGNENNSKQIMYIYYWYEWGGGGEISKSGPKWSSLIGWEKKTAKGVSNLKTIKQKSTNPLPCKLKRA